MAQNVAAMVDLWALSPLTEIVIRAGSLNRPDAKGILIDGYEDDPRYPNVFGLSTVFRQGASLDELARAAHFPHGKIGYSVIARIQQELAVVGYELVLFITPTVRYADHHTLGIMKNGQVQQTLDDVAADALLRAFTVVSNPYKGKP
jgi:hypothetical protein